ncbi:hypothetical protein EXN22_24245 [Pseudomonas tructae]|uniref:Uncharacterized protein n=1 Tax=Pseudomonas tructae TaxID=2518644 RepID=A0A411MP82_9PSED|nr:hypothetical protein EXN22_24245 [Pseudomonas tructae]
MLNGNTCNCCRICSRVNPALVLEGLDIYRRLALALALSMALTLLQPFACGALRVHQFCQRTGGSTMIDPVAAAHTSVNRLHYRPGNPERSAWFAERVGEFHFFSLTTN